ncbi:hypothetical protein RFI_39213 [Reticulomyxa filosa]|uniref:Ppx/GppA phosphatase N-terminal domain-containing protein n=1 Tax=Reticulomyxa filosa TaxID=46433 RepID=X6LAB1_RETFI|nr:hypothetical protein RFI_39213 [Reticulomyxa filosa]|eukprot:ETN98295.1 hypothetical protein RFI_39213 [Reticulomyxa filosa]
MQLKLCLLLLLSLFLKSSILFAKDSCLEKRYVFDIGSGSTKSKAYLVNKCLSKVIKSIGEINKHVRYQDCISSSFDKKTITKKCLDEGLKALKSIESGYKIDCNKEKCAGFATAWARDARNSEDVLSIFKEENIHIIPISQQEEGELGFKTAIFDPEIRETIDPKKVIAWDIGGGSFQLSALDNSGIVYTHEGQYGIFDLFQEIREKFPKAGHNVNKERYFEKDELEAIFKYTSNKVSQELAKDNFITSKLKDKDTRVIGIGRIMYLGLRHQLDATNPVTKAKIKCLAYEFTNISVEEAKKKYPKLPEHFASLVQQSLILIYGIMDSAGIDKFEIVNSTLTDHVAIDQDYWNN